METVEFCDTNSLHVSATCTRLVKSLCKTCTLKDNSRYKVVNIQTSTKVARTSCVNPQSRVGSYTSPLDLQSFQVKFVHQDLVWIKDIENTDSTSPMDLQPFQVTFIHQDLVKIKDIENTDYTQVPWIYSHSRLIFVHQQKVLCQQFVFGYILW